MKCFRVGKKEDKDGNPKIRPLVVNMRTKEKAMSYCNGDKGRRVEVGRREYDISDEDADEQQPSECYWINRDLCRADQEQNFLARVARKSRMSQRSMDHQ